VDDPPAGSADDYELLIGYRDDLARLRLGKEAAVPFCPVWLAVVGEHRESDESHRLGGG